MQTFFHFLIFTLLVAGCSQNTEPIKVSVPDNVATKEHLKKMVDATKAYYSLCTNLDTAYAHANEVETLMLDSEANLEQVNNKMRKLVNVEHIYLANANNINFELFFKEIQFLEKLNKLQIEDSKAINNSNLMKLKNKNIKSVVLKNNKLEIVKLNFLNSLNLEELIIVESNFVFSGIISPQTSLKTIFFSGNREKSLNAQLYKLKYLNHLTVFSSDLNFISPNIVHMSSLNELSILKCPLASNQAALLRLQKILQNKCVIITDDNYIPPYL